MERTELLILPNPPDAISGAADDMMTEYPQRTIAWGVFYFLLMAAVEIVAGWNTPGWTDAQVDEVWEKLGRKS